MPDYSKGKIYKIVNDVNDKFYIGSTTQPLYKRLSEHRKKDNVCMCKNIGVDLYKCSIILIENYSCNDKQELLRKEREYFDKYKKECKEVFLNKKRPIITIEERKERSIKYNKEHKEICIKASKKHRDVNKEEIKKKRSIKITCECGSIVVKRGMLDHKKSKKHLEFISSN